MATTLHKEGGSKALEYLNWLQNPTLKQQTEKQSNWKPDTHHQANQA
jgi:hypothetical protein